MSHSSGIQAAGISIVLTPPAIGPTDITHTGLAQAHHPAMLAGLEAALQAWRLGAGADPPEVRQAVSDRILAFFHVHYLEEPGAAVLDLSHIPMTAVPQHAMAYLWNVHAVDVSSTELTALDPVFAQLPHLRVLNASGNRNMDDISVLNQMHLDLLIISPGTARGNNFIPVVRDLTSLQMLVLVPGDPAPDILPARGSGAEVPEHFAQLQNGAGGTQVMVRSENPPGFGEIQRYLAAR